jgi:hypothetical protein
MFMKRIELKFGLLAITLASLLALGGCGGQQGDVAAQEAPPPQQVVQGVDVTLFSVEHPEQYPPPDMKRRRNLSPRVSCFQTSHGAYQ